MWQERINIYELTRMEFSLLIQLFVHHDETSSKAWNENVNSKNKSSSSVRRLKAKTVE